MKKFEHRAFVVGLGFVAGFIDVYGFTQLNGLLPAHVTGTLIFLAISLAHGEYDVLLKIAAVPIFCCGVLGAAWFIGTIHEAGRDPFLPALGLQAGLLLCSMAGGLALPQHSEIMIFTAGSFALLAMGLQNTIMRLILNNLPPTTVMTGNITKVLSDIVAYACRFSSFRPSVNERVILEHQTQRMLLTLLSFLGGALGAAFTCPALRHLALCIPILTILGLIPFGHRTLRTQR